MFPVSDSVFQWYDLGATFFWGMSGAMLAARKGCDIVGIFIIAMVSATGGGLIRDGLFLPGWSAPRLIQTPDYLVTVSIVTAIMVALGGWLRRQSWLPHTLALADALGIGAYGVVGMHLAVQAGIPMIGAMLIGFVNAVGGGVLRDLLVGREQTIFKPGTLNVIAALAGCGLFVALGEWTSVETALRAWATIALTFGLRAVAIRYNIQTTPTEGFDEAN